MLIRAALFAACLTLPPVAAHAADGRIRTILYTPRTVVTVSGRPNIQSTIMFGPDERIENVAIGDSAAWQVTPNKRANLLFVKPQAPKGRTNLTVITDRRTYLFDLVAQPAGGAGLYALEFAYPPAPPPPVEPPKAVQVVDASPPPPPAAAVETLNFRWAQKGAKRLMPHRVFDDGRSVYLAWDADTAVPAMLGVAPDGTEGPLNYTVKGEFVVIDGVPGRLVLRAGKESAVLDRLTAPGRAAAAHPATQIAER